MLALAAVIFLTASRSEVPAETWNCRNQIEVWCAADGCAATPPDESTPMDIWASVDGALSACAYSGCWEGSAKFTSIAGRLLWAGDGLAFSTAAVSPEAGDAGGDVSLLIVAEDGVGFVRAGGIATPVLCRRTQRFDH